MRRETAFKARPIACLSASKERSAKESEREIKAPKRTIQLLLTYRNAADVTQPCQLPLDTHLASLWNILLHYVQHQC